jgi:hypothetical protein
MGGIKKHGEDRTLPRIHMAWTSKELHEEEEQIFLKKETTTKE